MIRLCLVFVLLAVVGPLCNARPHKCEQRERSLADLDLAEDSLNRAKELYPNCEKENETSNSTECSNKDKSLGFIDVALDLVSNAKKNIPICPHVPTEEPVTTTEEPVTTTEEPVTTTEEPVTTTEPVTTSEEPFTTTDGPTPEVTTDSFRPMDCQELLAAGRVTSGVYTVWLRGGKSAVRVRCDMDTDGGGWTVIQRRGKFFAQENFTRNWHDYKQGFGSLERDFWLGNDLIFALSNQANYYLRMDMASSDGESAYALFQKFRIEDERANYTLHVSGASGTAGGSLINNDGFTFSAIDRNTGSYNQNSCGEKMKGGFWYNGCSYSNPNGVYMPGQKSYSSMNYHSFKDTLGLRSMDMKLRRL